ncbi:uncharacterized protein LOC114119918 [Aphis gossypii]|uniref:uncharacterized protein LOC114119918 n=1 Tax=Aphis gossypii TaxID=80765 RepID=UPI002158D31A|nr:uncharacterized protein LOC114119918 [Aphis gossypii]
MSIINTSSSPFKVTHENYIASTSQSSQKQINNVFNDKNDTLEKINRNVLNLKYKMRSLHEKIDKIDEMIRNNTMNSNIELNKDASVSDLFISLNSDFPLEDEDALQTFENKLLDNNCRVQLVAELARYVRNTLPSTIRAMMRFLFKDSLLQEYSYKGQKKKRVFSTLGASSIIFDAVKNMKRYQKHDKIDVEQPMKIFIAGAKFREHKTVELQSNTL